MVNKTKANSGTNRRNSSRYKSTSDNENTGSTSGESFFVRVGEPEDVRREILETSKMMIHVLQSQKKLESLRNEKSKKISEYKGLIKEINLIINKLKKKLPKTKLRAMNREEQLSVYAESHHDTKSKSRPKPKKEETSKKQQSKPKSEVDVLQSQLDDIESKLKGL